MSYEVHEKIGRKVQLAATMRIDEIVMRSNDAYPDLPPTFHCRPLLADITLSACAANYARGLSSCVGCPVGQENSGETPRSVVPAMACIRCEKSAHTNKRLIGRMRLVRSSTLCVSCFNRERECVKGVNSKGMAPKKWAHLKAATITIKDADGEHQDIDIGLRVDHLECARYVERVHPGATLIKTAIGGEIISQFSLWTPLPLSPWEPGIARAEQPKKPQRTYTNRVTSRSSKTSKANVTPVDWDDWDTPLYAKPASDDYSDADGNGTDRRAGWLPPLTEEDDAAYRASFNEPAIDPESIAAFWDFTADGLADFVEWLCEGWTEPVSDAQNKPAEAIAPTVEPEAFSAPLRDAMAESVSKLEAIEEVRPLTRKERREYARLEAKIAKKQLRAAQQTAKHMPATKAKATAIASRALAIFDSMSAAAR